MLQSLLTCSDVNKSSLVQPKWILFCYHCVSENVYAYNNLKLNVNIPQLPYFSDGRCTYFTEFHGTSEQTSHPVTTPISPDTPVTISARWQHMAQRINLMQWATFHTVEEQNIIYMCPPFRSMHLTGTTHHNLSKGNKLVLLKTK